MKKNNKLSYLILLQFTKQKGLFLIAFLILVAVQTHNLFAFPVSRGFDASGHLEYIKFLQTEKRLPLPYECWELWQPPLYYILAMFFPNINLVKIIGFISWLIIVICAYLLLKQSFADKIFALAGMLIIAAQPVLIYLTPTISNELFSAALISVAIFYYQTKKNQLILGAVLGLAILTKATACLLIWAIFLDQILKYHIKPIILFKNLAIFFSVALVIGGWFYIRNIIFFGNPFTASFDFPNLYPLTQPTVSRNIRFFTDVNGFLELDLFQSQHYSFLAGTYFSWFYDGHNIIIPPQQFSKAGAVLVIFSLPIFLIGTIGFIQAIKKFAEKERIFIIYIISILISYILYNFRLPFYSTVKGSFLVSAVIPFGYFFISGWHSINAKQNRLILYACCYAIIVSKNFWILPHWY